MKYNFDERIDRQGTDSVNVEEYEAALFGGEPVSYPCKKEDIIRMWVADMDFATPDVVIDGIKKRLEQRIFGYTRVFDPGYYEAFSSWTQRRYGWQCKREELVTSGGVVPALDELVEYICAPDEKVLIFTPSYGPFQKAAQKNRRDLICAELQKQGSEYHIDFQDLERKLEDPKLRLCIFCNPHNPTGRLWTEEELRTFADLCIQRDIWIISDEIHCDLLRSGKQHTPLAKLYPNYQKIITCMAPSKTFNIAGLMFSNVIIPDETLRNTWLRRHHNSDNPLSLAASRAAYEAGEPWLKELLAYIDGNLEVVKESIDKNLPKAIFAIPEATYLAWIDLSAYFPPGENLIRFFAERAGVLVEDCSMFVGNGDGCIRLNLACPRDVVEEAMNRICKAVNEK